MRVDLGTKGLPALRPPSSARPRRSNGVPTLRRLVSRLPPRLTPSRLSGMSVLRAQKGVNGPCLPPRRKDAVKSSDGPLRDATQPSDRKGPTGSVLGAIALITGSTVGAGMLALPAATAGGGFLPSTSIMTVTCGLLILEALLIAEVNLTIMKKRQARGEPAGVVNFRQMAVETLGPAGGKVTSYLYLFLSYTLLLAYIAKGSELVNLLSMDAIPTSEGGPLFALVMGAFLFRGDTESVDVVNRALTFGLLALFAMLVAGGASLADWGSLLHHQDWGQAWGGLPVIFLSLVFHDLIPVLCNYLGGDKGKVRTAIVAGAMVPLGMFFVWDAVALSLVPGAVDVANAGGIIDPLRVLIESLGPSAGLAIEVFSLLAIVTSFIGTMLGFSNYLRTEIKGWEKRQVFDVLRPKPEEGEEVQGGLLGDEAGKLAAISLALVPPTLAAVASPDLFYVATQVAGGYGTTLMYGILPPLMAWSARPVGTVNQRFAPLMPMVPGGRKVLASITSCAAAIEVGKLAADSNGLVNGLATVGSKVGTATNLVIGDLAAFESSVHLGHW